MLGDKWTILVLREAFFGVHRFNEFARNLAITNRNLLTGRLRLLVDAGVSKRADDGGGRVDYRLTPSGRDLYPVLMTLMAWGDRHLAGPEGPPMTLLHRTCRHALTPVLACEHCRHPIDPRDIDPRPGPGYRLDTEPGDTVLNMRHSPSACGHENESRPGLFSPDLPFCVELPGIEPGSYGIPSRLLRAQFAMPLLGSPDHANKSG